jgi:hypothetical protein
MKKLIVLFIALMGTLMVSCDSPYPNTWDKNTPAQQVDEWCRSLTPNSRLACINYYVYDWKIDSVQYVYNIIHAPYDKKHILSYSFILNDKKGVQNYTTHNELWFETLPTSADYLTINDVIPLWIDSVGGLYDIRMISYVHVMPGFENPEPVYQFYGDNGEGGYEFIGIIGAVTNGFWWAWEDKDE